MSKRQQVKTLREALDCIDRLFKLIEQKDAQIKQLKERVAMLEFARGAKLEKAKPITERIQ